MVAQKIKNQNDELEVLKNTLEKEVGKFNHIVMHRDEFNSAIDDDLQVYLTMINNLNHEADEMLKFAKSEKDKSRLDFLLQTVIAANAICSINKDLPIEDVRTDISKALEPVRNHPALLSDHAIKWKKAALRAGNFLGCLIGLVLTPLMPLIIAAKGFKAGFEQVHHSDVEAPLQKSFLRCLYDGMKGAIGGLIVGTLFAPFIGMGLGYEKSMKHQTTKIKDLSTNKFVSSVITFFDDKAKVNEDSKNEDKSGKKMKLQPR